MSTYRGHHDIELARSRGAPAPADGLLPVSGRLAIRRELIENVENVGHGVAVLLSGGNRLDGILADPPADRGLVSVIVKHSDDVGLARTEWFVDLDAIVGFAWTEA